MSSLEFTHEAVNRLSLCDGMHIDIAAGNDLGKDVVIRLADIMQLERVQPTHSEIVVIGKREGEREDEAVHEFIGSEPFAPARYLGHGRNLQLPVSIFHSSHSTICSVDPEFETVQGSIHFTQLSLAIARHVQIYGGLLLHGALAECEQGGVVLAGPGGIGKTTAMKRLPPHWEALSDDATVIVCDQNKKYWAHPWPTWSRFWNGGTGGRWNVRRAVPLKAIFFVSQAQRDSVKPVGMGQAVAMLIELNQQVSQLISYTEKGEVREHRMKCFDTICRMVKTLPVKILHLSLQGPFWEKIEKSLSDHEFKR